VVELRGNVDTRLRKLADGEVDAIVLARAGLERLGRLEEAGAVLHGETFVPAAGQGVLALEGRLDDPRASAAARAVQDEAAWTCLLAERAVVRTLGADCHSAVGAHATLEGAELRLSAFVGASDGSHWIRDEGAGPADDPEALGEAIAGRLLRCGSAELLGR